MKTSLAITITILLSIGFLAGCGQTSTELPTNTPPVIADTKTSTPTKAPTVTPSSTIIPTEIPTLTPTETNTPTPTPTPVPPPQTLGRIFRTDGPGVIDNTYDPKFEGFSGLHFDVGLPFDCEPGTCDVLIPASGIIVNHYSAGEGWGEVITVSPDHGLLGVEDYVRDLGYDPSKIQYVFYHLGHINPIKTTGKVEVGEVIGTPTDLVGNLGQWIDKVAYVVRIGFRGEEVQISPCELPNTASFCGKCDPRTSLNCP